KLKPTRISSYKAYESIFGGSQPEGDGLQITIKDIIKEFNDDDPGKEEILQREIRASVAEESKVSRHVLSYAIQMYYANGGGPCYIVSVGSYLATEKPTVADLEAGVAALAGEDEPTMIVVPEASLIEEFSSAKTIYEKALAQAAKLQDRVVLLDVQQKKAKSGSQNLEGDVIDDLKAFRANFTENASYGAAYYPYLDTTIDFSYVEDGVAITHKRKAVNGSAEKDGKYNGKKLLTDLAKGADGVRDNLMYNTLKDALTNVPMKLPPSAAIAGIYAKTDADRGVWKAPANVGVAAVIGPNIKIDDEMQRDMNVHADSGKSVNAIRQITGRGTVVWGARTLDGNSNEWRYVNVRRFFNFVEESVKKATYRFVFEPNDANTWVKVRAMCENFLTLQWRAGALQGSKPEQAFFVRVGLGQTMTPDDVLNGRLIVEIGMAVVRPAEFIVLRFMHKMPEA
ncbi:MAG TPA: phage tail sheath C-terminal domain-containing protein, partial [Saprospiraceae bacterium]|nr:phage tail sheath C-terminal domain-containing protein [Saprospiraceae bacterium]